MTQEVWEELTVDGAMLEFIIKVEEQVPNVLMLEMTLGTVAISMTRILVLQDGHAIAHHINVLWPNQVKVSVVKTNVRNIVVVKRTPTDAIPPTILAKHAQKESQVVAQIEQQHVRTARIQLHQLSTNAIRPTLRTQNVTNVRRVTQDARLMPMLVMAATLHDLHQRDTHVITTKLGVLNIPMVYL